MPKITTDGATYSDHTDVSPEGSADPIWVADEQVDAQTAPDEQVELSVERDGSGDELPDVARGEREAPARKRERTRGGQAT